VKNGVTSPKNFHGEKLPYRKHVKIVYTTIVHTTNIERLKILHALTEQCWNYNNLDGGFHGYETSMTTIMSKML
jgi:hypothetical protein